MNYNKEILLKEAKEAILDRGHASTSLLQRRLRLGYSDAFELMETLEKEGFIGGQDGAKPREILKVIK